MGDEDDGAAGLRELACEAEGGFGLLLGEYRGGFVHDQDFRARQQDFHDFEFLAVGYRHLIHAAFRVQAEAELLAQFLHGLERGGLGFPPRAARTGEANVLKHAERAYEFEMLVNHADAGGGGGGRIFVAHRVAVHLHNAGIGGVEA